MNYDEYYDYKTVEYEYETLHASRRGIHRDAAVRIEREMQVATDKLLAFTGASRETGMKVEAWQKAVLDQMFDSSSSGDPEEEAYSLLVNNIELVRGEGVRVRAETYLRLRTLRSKMEPEAFGRAIRRALDDILPATGFCELPTVSDEPDMLSELLSCGCGNCDTSLWLSEKDMLEDIAAMKFPSAMVNETFRQAARQGKDLPWVYDQLRRFQWVERGSGC